MSAAVLIGAVLEQHGRAQTERTLLREARAHCMDVRHTPPLADLLASPSMRSISLELESALGSNAPILILGESGCGKTLMAQAIAEASGRKPVVRATLGGSDDLNTITSELFGHERGAYSGATSKRVGLVEFADGGTLILDELLNLPAHAQQLLLDWSGNVRQLEGAIERARERAVLRDPEATTLTPEHLEARDLGQTPALPVASPPEESAVTLGATWQRLQAERARLDEREQSVLRHALAQSGGVVAQAARELGIARTTLSSRIDALAIRPPRRYDPAK